MPAAKAARRSQKQRTAETRSALIDATIEVIFQAGYGAATTALIAERAGLSRGAFLHHFRSRAALMAEVVRAVFEREMAQYEQIVTSGARGGHFADWPLILWDVLGQPSGVAVLEILQAARSDPELAEVVEPMQIAVEQDAVTKMAEGLESDKRSSLIAMRLVVWAIRGLTLAKTIVPDPDTLRSSVELLASLIDRSAPSGRPSDLFN